MVKQKILKAYEELAPSYDEKIDTKPHNAYYDRPNTLMLLGNVSGKHILDAACGPGKYAEILMQQGAQVTGFDISPSMVKLAKKRNQERGNFYVHDLATPNTHIEDSSYDIVLCALALHYIKDWTITLADFYRILKPGGEMVISIEHPFFDYQYFQSKKYFEIEEVHATWSGFGKPVTVHCHRRSLQDCINPIMNAGFQLTQILEPKPTEEFLRSDPRHYHELMEFPSFLHLKAKKN